MVDILATQSSQPASLRDSLTNAAGEELAELALTRGVNLAQLISKTYLMVEEGSNKKSHQKIDELQAQEKKLKSVTDFLSLMEAQLANPDARKVDLADKSSIVEEMHQLCDHVLLKKSVWTREEAETIRTSLTRHSQVIMQQLSYASSTVNRSIEEGTELLQIARKVLEMCQQLHQTFTRNQKL